jgi:hypothetical protein
MTVGAAVDAATRQGRDSGGWGGEDPRDVPESEAKIVPDLGSVADGPSGSSMARAAALGPCRTGLWPRLLKKTGARPGAGAAAQTSDL